MAPVSSSAGSSSPWAVPAIDVADLEQLNSGARIGSGRHAAGPSAEVEQLPSLPPPSAQMAPLSRIARSSMRQAFSNVIVEAQSVDDELNGEPIVRPRPVAPWPKRVLTPRVTAAPHIRDAVVTWVSVHGGAGSTSLVSASSLGVDVTGKWPDPALGWPCAVALVCRTNMAGFDAASTFIHEWAAGATSDLEVVALVTVADSPAKLTRALRDRLSELSATVPTVLSIPWIPEWREIPYGLNSSVERTLEKLFVVPHEERENA